MASKGLSIADYDAKFIEFSRASGVAKNVKVWYNNPIKAKPLYSIRLTAIAKVNLGIAQVGVRYNNPIKAKPLYSIRLTAIAKVNLGIAQVGVRYNNPII